MREFTDEQGAVWSAFAAEEDTPRHHGRWYLVLRPVGAQVPLLAAPEVRRRLEALGLAPVAVGVWQSPQRWLGSPLCLLSRNHDQSYRQDHFHHHPRPDAQPPGNFYLGCLRCIWN